MESLPPRARRSKREMYAHQKSIQCTKDKCNSTDNDADRLFEVSKTNEKKDNIGNSHIDFEFKDLIDDETNEIDEVEFSHDFPIRDDITIDSAFHVNMNCIFSSKNIKPDFEYLEHPADVILHSSGETFLSALSSCAYAMLNYMTDLTKVDTIQTRKIEIYGRDLYDLYYHFLNEILYLYGSEYFLCRYMDFLAFNRKKKLTRESQKNENFMKTDNSDMVSGKNLYLRALCHGEHFDRQKHTQGTEIKAITMHQMRITLKNDPDRKVELFALVDI